MKRTITICLAVAISMLFGLSVGKPYESTDEQVGGEVGPSPYITVEPTEDSFPSAEKAEVRVTWHNPTKSAFHLQRFRSEYHVHVPGASRPSEREEKDLCKPIYLSDWSWCSVDVTPPGGPWPRPDKYMTTRDQMFERQVGFGSFLYGYEGVQPRQTRSCEMPLTAYVHPSAIGPGKHALEYTTRFSYFSGDGPQSRIRWSTSKGTIRFTIDPKN